MRPDWVVGLDRGFDEFSFPPQAEVPASVTLDRVEEWLGRHAEGPFFLWIHLFDPHMPYVPPPPYDSMYLRGRSLRR